MVQNSEPLRSIKEVHFVGFSDRRNMGVSNRIFRKISKITGWMVT